MFIGIDVGTTGTKSIIVDDKGDIVQYSYKGYDCFFPAPNHVEQNIEDILNVIIETVRDCVSKIENQNMIESLSVSVQSGTMVPYNENKQTYGPAITWQDSRCGKEAEKLLDQYGINYFYKKTGWRLGASLNFIQIYRITNNPGEKKYTHYLSVSDCVTKLLTGEYYTDLNSAGNSQLLNIHLGKWDPDLLNIAGISERQLGKLLPPGSFIGTIRKDTAEKMGLNENVKIYLGAQDQFCSAISAGVLKPGDAMFSTGTSWVMMAVTEKPEFETSSFPSIMKHVVSDFFTSYTFIPAGGSALKWLKNNILYEKEQYEKVSYDEIVDAAISISPGAEGLFFFPQLAGTAYPTWNEKVKGAFIGLDFIHNRKHIIRSVLEGLAYEINISIKRLEKQGIRINNIFGLGGATRNRNWMQIVCDIMEKPIIISNFSDMAPMGAAMIAAVGCGKFPDYYSSYCAFGLQEKQKLYLPGKNKNIYRDLFAQYEDAYNKRCI